MHFTRSIVPPDTNLVLFDIQMPKCSPKQICNIHQIQTIHDGSSSGIRWSIMASLDPNTRFVENALNDTYKNDVFYYKIIWTISNSGTHGSDAPTHYPYPIAYPYEKMRWATITSSVATGTKWDILIFYTIEPIDAKQLTAITLRRGTVRHAREQGPEPGGPG